MNAQTLSGLVGLEANPMVNNRFGSDAEPARSRCIYLLLYLSRSSEDMS